MQYGRLLAGILAACSSERTAQSVSCEALPSRPNPVEGRTGRWFRLAGAFGFPAPIGSARGWPPQGRIRARGSSLYVAVGALPLRIDIEENTACHLGGDLDVAQSQRLLDIGAPENSHTLVALYASIDSLPPAIRVSFDDGVTWSKATLPEPGREQPALPGALTHAERGPSAGEWFVVHGGDTLDVSVDDARTWSRVIEGGHFTPIAFSVDYAGETLWWTYGDISASVLVRWAPLSQARVDAWNSKAVPELMTMVYTLVPDPGGSGVLIGGYAMVGRLTRRRIW